MYKFWLKDFNIKYYLGEFRDHLMRKFVKHFCKKDVYEVEFYRQDTCIIVDDTLYDSTNIFRNLAFNYINICILYIHYSHNIIHKKLRRFTYFIRN